MCLFHSVRRLDLSSHESIASLSTVLAWWALDDRLCAQAPMNMRECVGRHVPGWRARARVDRGEGQAGQGAAALADVAAAVVAVLRGGLAAGAEAAARFGHARAVADVFEALLGAGPWRAGQQEDRRRRQQQRGPRHPVRSVRCTNKADDSCPSGVAHTRECNCMRP